MNAFKTKTVLAATLTLGVLLGTSSSALAQALRCETIFSSAVNIAAPVRAAQESFYAKRIEIDAQGYSYAKGVKGEGKEIQFGFESEYGLKELAPFTKFYGPTPEAGISKQSWLAMPVEKRMEWIEAKLKTIPFGAKDPVLVLLDKSPELSFLPSKLIRDDTGNVEIILAPVSKFETWREQVLWVNENFGVGSMQSMVSQPRESFYSKVEGLKDLTLKENIGYFNFLHDADVISRMAQGADKFSKDPTKDVMRPFLHPYLGPMIQLRQKKMTDLMTEISDGKPVPQEALEAVVRLEHSFKYIGSTSYRPDIGGPTRVSQEIRDTHKDVNLLIDRTARSIFYAQKGRTPFIPMAKLKAFDSRKNFEEFPVEVQNILKSVFPIKAPKDFKFESAQLVHETYRNFAYPLRNWRQVLQALDRMDLAGTVKAARENYIAKLQHIEVEYSRGALSKELASAQIQGALAMFAKESRLSEAFVKFEAELPAKYSGMPYNLTSARRGFELRLQSFMQLWPNNTRVVDSLTFKYKDPGQKSASDRNMLMISTENLTPAELTRIQADYLKLVSEQTVSFPLKERASHTLVQFNGTVYNFGYFLTQKISQFRIGDYKVPSSRRIEVLSLLTRTEENNLHAYIRNIKQDKRAVLGRFNLEGDPQTNGMLKDNRSECGNNCTTWITMAPIGKNGESIATLMGGNQTVPWIKQNPGWWGSWALGTASVERSPLVVYWTNKSVEKALETEIKDRSFEWDFNRK